MTQRERETLLLDLEAEHRRNATGFERVRNIASRLPELKLASRGRVPPFGPWLKALGPAALAPMLEELLNGRPGGRDDKALWTAWRVGLLEAIGELRSDRAAPFLRAIIATADQPEIATAAIAAYARLGRDEVASDLVAYARSTPVLRRAALAGMGHCRRAVVARELARALSAHPAGALAVSIVRSLGDVGSSWVWRTGSMPVASEEQEVRSLAAEALLTAFIAYDGEVRAEAQRALLLVDEAQTQERISTALRTASRSQRDALVGLERRFAESPVH
jgi:hypothetical protein